MMRPLQPGNRSHWGRHSPSLECPLRKPSTSESDNPALTPCRTNTLGLSPSSMRAAGVSSAM